MKNQQLKNVVVVLQPQEQQVSLPKLANEYYSVLLPTLQRQGINTGHLSTTSIVDKVAIVIDELGQPSFVNNHEELNLISLDKFNLLGDDNLGNKLIVLGKKEEQSVLDKIANIAKSKIHVSSGGAGLVEINGNLFNIRRGVTPKALNVEIKTVNPKLVIGL